MLNSPSDVVFPLKKRRVKWTVRWSYQEDGKNIIIYSFWNNENDPFVTVKPL